jgi:hypothetical protein
MARYFAFFVVGCAFTVGVVGMVETHRQVSNTSPQVVAYHSAQSAFTSVREPGEFQ